MIVEKVLKRGGKSHRVELLRAENGTKYVRKYYNKVDRRQVQNFTHELKILKHLQECDFVPKIIEIDQKNAMFVMTYCGEDLRRGAISKSQAKLEIRKLLKKLDNEWGVIRFDAHGHKTYDIELNNVCYKEGKISIIDFGSQKWKFFTARKI